MNNRVAKLRALLPPEAKRALATLLALSILAALAELAIFAALFAFLTRMAAPGSGLERAAGLFMLAAVAAALIRLWLNARTQRLSAQTGHYLAVETQRRLLAQPLAFHAGFNSARGLAMLDKAQQVTDGVLLPAIGLTQAALVGGAALLAVAWTTPIAALIVGALILGLYALLARISRRTIAATDATLSGDFDRRAQTVQESFAGIRDVLLDSLQGARTAAFADVDQRLGQRLATLRVHSAAPRFAVEGIGMALLAGLAWWLSGQGMAAALPALGMIAFGALRLLPMANAGYSSWLGWQASGAILDEVTEALALPLPTAPPANAAAFERSVELREVRFAYPGGRSVLDGVSLRIERGERVGIVGATGAGKSTLGDLLMGLLDPDEGSLLVDSAPIDDGAAWQKNIAHVGQQLFLLDASIAENVAFGDSSPQLDRVVASLNAACLPDFATRLDTAVGERGLRLSGGERQRLGLARAFYKRRPFLVLDEATSALDEDTERRVLANIEVGTTVLVISHRPGPLALCSRRFSLADGQLSPV